jgi:phospholipid transport system substrate-binding protein
MIRALGRLFPAFVMVLCCAAAWAGPAQDTLKSDVDEVLSVLRSTKPGDAARTQMLSRTLGKFFDAQELARRTLAVNWSKFSPEEQANFTQVFVQLLEHTYIRRIETYTNEQVVFLGESQLAGDRAEVSTKIITSNREVPIIYRLARKSDTWKVYDVVIEGVSLVQNYRNQFEQVLAKESPAQLIERVKSIDASPSQGNPK